MYMYKTPNWSNGAQFSTCGCCEREDISVKEKDDSVKEKDDSVKEKDESVKEKDDSGSFMS